MTSELAIVIPAYKARFFKQTLESIANQTCLDFVLYVGDDASPEDLKTIVEQVSSKIQVEYIRFSENLGGVDLVAHWDRCLNLVKEHEWIWLFSDDDLMEPNCVEKFYLNKQKFPNVDLFHFDIVIIDEHGTVTKKCNQFPEHMNVDEFFYKRINFQINSTVIEFIFKKETYYATHGFKNYDLAWCSDDATWIRLGTRTGIQTIAGPIVSWRYSGANISSQISDKSTVLRKMDSLIEHIGWVQEYFAQHNLTDNTTSYQKLKWLISLIVVTPALSSIEKISILRSSIKKLAYKDAGLRIYLYLLYKEIRFRTI